MNKEEKELVAKGDRLFELREDLLKLAKTATEHFFRMGTIMKEIRDDELWKEQYESFRAFYSDPDLGFKTSSVYHSIRLVELFPEWKKFVDIPIRKLQVIAPYVNEKNRNEMVNMARALSTGDLKYQLTLKRIAEVEPRLEPLPKIYPCSKCGKVRGISWDMLCHCGWTPKQIAYVSKIIERIDYGDEEQEG